MMSPENPDGSTAHDQPATQAMQSAAAPSDDESLAKLLAARGIPPEEIQRLLALPRHDTSAGLAPTAATPEVEPTQVFAPQKFEPKPTLTFPEFRDPSPSEAEEAERLLRNAHLERRRGRFQQALEQCLAAIDRAPRDAAALEMLGDILQALGRVDDAVAAYHRAGEADPSRSSAERKYAELVLLQDRSVAILTRLEEPRNPYMAVMLSALFPGAGQYYNGERAKAAIFGIISLALLIFLLWTPWGLASSGMGLSPTASFLIAALGIVYVLSLVDANLGARSPRRRSSGWDV